MSDTHADKPSRVFIAVWPGDELLDALEAFDRRIRRTGERRLVPRVARHVTIAFIGDTAIGEITKISEAVRRAIAGAPPFRARPIGVVTLPTERAPRLLACGFEGASGLDALRDRVLGALLDVAPTEPIVRDMERNAEHHITIHRAQRGRKVRPEVRTCLLGPGAPEPDDGWPPLVVDRVSLVRSDLTPAGAVYTRLAEMPLGAGGGDSATR